MHIPALCLSCVNTFLSHWWYQIQRAFDVIKFHRLFNLEFLHVFSIHTSFIFAVTLLCPCHSSNLDLFACVSNTEPPVNDDTHFPLWFLQPHSWSSLKPRKGHTKHPAPGVSRHLSKWAYDAFCTKAKAEFPSSSCLPSFSSVKLFWLVKFCMSAFELRPLFWSTTIYYSFHYLSLLFHKPFHW